MKKTKLAIEQIISGALLLGFDNISKTDINLLAEDFLRKNPDYEFTAPYSDYLNRYIKSENEKISLKDGLNMNSYLPENDSNLHQRLREITGKCIRKYIETFDKEAFMLRKIKHQCGIDVDTMDNLWCKKQQEWLKELDEKGYLTTYWTDDCIYDDCQKIDLYGTGKVALFKIDNAKEIEEFIKILKTLRYDTNLLDDFLIKQDLEKPVCDILTIENLNDFCNEYDRAIVETGASGVYFERLKNQKGTIFDEEGKKVIENMLSVWDDGHCIYICHPNHIFDGEKLITSDVRDIRNVNWDDIDIEKMFKINDYKTFIVPNCTEAFKYVHGRLGHQIMTEVKKGNKDKTVSFLTVVEKYHYDYENYYLIRGIIKGDYEGYSVAINPEYQKIIPQSVWDKSLRFSGHEVPQAYCLKKKK